MKFMSVFPVFFVAGLALAAPEPQPLERRQGAVLCPLEHKFD
jgi:hypothetical protein